MQIARFSCKIVGLVMGIFYLVLGVIILCWEDVPMAAPALRTAFGILLVVYGAFRLGRSIKKEPTT